MAARDIQFVIKAQDEASRAFETIAGALQQLMTAQGSLAGSAEGVNSDLTTLVETLGSFDKAASLITGSSDRAAAAYEKQTAKIAELNAQLAALQGQAKAADQALSNVKGAGAATGEDAAAAARIQAITAAQDNLSKSKTKLIAQIDREQATLKTLGTQYQRVASIANTVDQARPMVGGFMGAGGAATVEKEATALGKFGTEAKTNARAITEVVVLAREASRDNFSRMAGSATILLQALGLMKAAFLVPFVGLAAALGTVVVAMVQVADEASRLRSLEAILRASADAADYNAKAIAANVDNLRAYRIAVGDAMAAVETFIKVGLNPADFEAFGRAAKDSFKVDPTQFKDVKDAAKQIAEAFTGGYDAIVKLDDATNFLSTTERQHIRTLFDEGQASKARTEAFEDYRKKMNDGADESKTKWTPAAEKLADAWAHLGDTLSNTKAFEGAKGVLDNIAEGIDGIATLIEGKGRKFAMIQLGFQIERAHELRQDPGLQASLQADPTLKSQDGPAAEEYKQVLADIARLKGQIAEYDKQGAAASKATVDPALAAAKVRQQAVIDAQHGLDLQTQLENATTSFDRIRVEGQQAYNKEMEKSGNAQVAQIARLQAEAKLRTEIERSAVATFTRNVIGAEGGPGQNPHSTAEGFGQFTKGTWLEQFKQVFAEQAKGLSDAQILALRKNEDTAKILIENYAQQNAAQLKKFGEVASATNLYLAHFLGVAGANKVLKADPSTPVDQLGLGKKALSGNQQYLRNDNGKGAYRTAGELQTFIAGRIGDTTNDQMGSERQAYADLLKKQTDLNTKLQEENAQRTLTLGYLQKEQGATVDQKNALERQKAVDEAIKKARDEQTKVGGVLSPDQQKAIEESVGKVYDLEHAEKLVNDRLNEQQALRDALLKGITEAEQASDTSTVTALTKALGDTDTAFSAAIDAAEKYWSQFNSPEAKAAIERLHQMRKEVADTAAQLANIHLDAINQKISGFTNLQGALQSSVGQQQLLGDSAGAKQSEQELAAVNIQLVQIHQNAIDAATAMLAFSDDTLAGLHQTRAGLEAFILEQKAAQEQTQLMGRQFLQTGKQINEMLADNLVSGMENFLTMVSQGKNVFSSLGIAAAQTAADILKSLGEMILKQALFNALSAHSSSGGGGVGGSLATAAAALFPASIALHVAGGTLTAAGAGLGVAGGTLTAAAAAWLATAAAIQAAATTLMIANSASVFGGAHTGGIAGSPTMHRSVSPLVFAGAIRYHLGGLAGLRPNEVPTILERGEEVLTRGDPRHRNNMGRGGGQGSSPNLKQVLVLDPKEIPAAMASSAGEKVFLTFISRNQQQLRQILGK